MALDSVDEPECMCKAGYPQAAFSRLAPKILSAEKRVQAKAFVNESNSW